MANCTLLPDSLSECPSFGSLLTSTIEDMTASNYQAYYWNVMFGIVTVSMVIAFVFPVDHFQMTMAIRRMRAAGLTSRFWLPFSISYSPVLFETSGGVTSAVQFKDDDWQVVPVTNVKQVDLWDDSQYLHDYMPPFMFGLGWLVNGALLTTLFTLIFETAYVNFSNGVISGAVNQFGFWTLLFSILSYKGWAMIAVFTWAPEFSSVYDAAANMDIVRSHRHYYGTVLMLGAHLTSVALFWTAFWAFIRPNIDRSPANHLHVFTEGSSLYNDFAYSAFIIVGTILSSTFLASLASFWTATHSKSMFTAADGIAMENTGAAYRAATSVHGRGHPTLRSAPLHTTAM